MKNHWNFLFLIVVTLFLNCSVTHKKLQSSAIEGDVNYSLLIDEVISYGKENLGFAFKNCIKIKSSADLDEDYYCQFRLWKRYIGNYSSKDATLPDSSFLFDEKNRLVKLNLDESLINHCVEIIEGAKDSKYLTSGLSEGTMIFSPLIPTISPHFFTLWVHVVRDRDPPEMVFSFINEGMIYRVTAGSWDDVCF